MNELAWTQQTNFQLSQLICQSKIIFKTLLDAYGYHNIETRPCVYPLSEHCQLSRCLTRRSWSTSLTTRHAMLDTTGIYFDTLHHTRLPWFHHPVIYPNIPSIVITLIALDRLFYYVPVRFTFRSTLFSLDSVVLELYVVERLFDPSKKDIFSSDEGNSFRNFNYEYSIPLF